MVLQSIDIKKQKNRFKLNTNKLKLNFGDCGVASSNEGRVELVHLSNLKKYMKNFVKKKKNNIDVIRERIWYLCSINSVLQKKSKNSRMGKGKGLFERKIIKIKKDTIIFEFSGISNNRLKNFIHKINKKLDISLFLYNTKYTYYRIWSKHNRYIFFYNKYLL